jgi:hypothetical protein
MRQLCLIVAILCALVAAAANITQVIAVTVLSADLASQTVYAKTVDGNKLTLRFSSRTPITSLAQAGMNRSLHGGAGYQFIVHYQVVQGEKVATVFHYIGREEWKKSRGTIVSTDPTIVLKTDEGLEEEFVAGQNCAVQTTSGAKLFAPWAKARTSEQMAIVYYTVMKNGKVTHLIDLQGL